MLFVFDLDGTCYNNEQAISQADDAAFASIGWRMADGANFIFQTLRGRDSRSKFNAVAKRLNKNLDDEDSYKAYRAARNAGLDGAIRDRVFAPYCGAIELVRHIQNKNRAPAGKSAITPWWTAAATNNPYDRARRTMAIGGLDQLIAPRWTIAPDLNPDFKMAAKPKPDMIEYVMRLQGFTPDQVVMIGDSKNDVLAARALGACVICFSDPALPGAKAHRNTLIDAGAHAIIERFDIAEFELRLAALKIRAPFIP